MLFQIACRNLIANRRKSVAALLSILVAFMTLALFEGYLRDIRGVYNAIFAKRQMLGQVVVERFANPNPGKAGIDENALDKKEQDWIEAKLDQNLVKAHNKFLNISGIITSGNNRAVFVGQAYIPAAGAIFRSPEYLWNTFAGRPLDKEDEAYPMLLGRELGEVVGCKASSESTDAAVVCEDKDSNAQLQVSTEGGHANALDFKVTGLTSTGFAEADARMAVLPLTVAQTLFATERVSYMTLLFNEDSKVDSWIKDFNAKAEKEGVKVTASRWQDHSFGDLYRQSMGFLKIFRDLVISIILVVVTITTVNTFVKIVNERMREIGTMRSIGYKPRHIVGLFCSEAGLLALGGSVLGALLSIVAAQAANAVHFVYNAGFMSEGFIFKVGLSGIDFIWITILMLLLTLIATFVPSWKATRVSISEILAER